MTWYLAVTVGALLLFYFVVELGWGGGSEYDWRPWRETDKYEKYNKGYPQRRKRFHHRRRSKAWNKPALKQIEYKPEKPFET